MPTCSPERTRFAELLRAFYLGRITNFEFEEAVDPLFEREPNLRVIFHRGPWGSYSDNREEKFTDKNKLNSESRKVVARWILFLKSGQPYLWPAEPPPPAWVMYPLFFSGIPIAWYTDDWRYFILGLFPVIAVGLIRERIALQRITRIDPDYKFWPFHDPQSLEQAHRFPPYLKGAD